MKFFVDCIKNTEGCVFVYSRFVFGGAIPLALVLEANGYTPYGRTKGLLEDGISISIETGGRQCALCPLRESEHNEDHMFSPAYYGLLTGDLNLSPKNEETIKAQRHINNVNGKTMKVVIGSQIASEGVDFRFIRETHIIDAWFHLNKTEQILGRAIRYLSHCALPIEKRNNTVYLYTTVLPERESIDLYSYRMGFNKAVLIGNVTRIMKQSSLDCNLNYNAIVIQNQELITQIDSQRLQRDDVDINDAPYTAICDWIDNCEYSCNPKINIETLNGRVTVNKQPLDESTYDEYSIRWRIEHLKKLIRKLFEDQPFIKKEDFFNIFSGIPQFAITQLLNEIINHKVFKVYHNNIPGYIRYCNTYFIFQPYAYKQLNIPLAMRTASYPIKRDYFPSIVYEKEDEEKERKKEEKERKKEEKEREKYDRNKGKNKNKNKNKEEEEEEEEDKEEEEEEEEEFQSDVDLLWVALDKWVTALSNSNVYIPSPIELEHRRITIAEGDIAISNKYSEIIHMIDWFHTSFVKQKNKHSPASFRYAILSFFWDELLTFNEQRYLAYLPNMRENVKEWLFISEGRESVIRFLHPPSGNIMYLCENKECSQPIIDLLLENDEFDKIDNTNTGKLYGFMVPKNDNIVFKKNNPPTARGKLGKGKECVIVSTMTGHHEDLVILGSILNEAGYGTFDLTISVMKSRARGIVGSNRACTLLHITLRFMDREKIQGKRWFYRPVEAFYLGHVGLYRKKK